MTTGGKGEYNQAMEDNLEKRIRELRARAAAGGRVFSDFLTPEERARTGAEAGGLPLTAWGGAEFAERKMICFGAEELEGSAFPLKIVEIAFEDAGYNPPPGHRDLLGAALGLGLERRALGDLFAGEERAFLVIRAELAGYLTDRLTRAGRHPVRCRPVEAVPEEFAPRREEVLLSLPSLRLDALIARLYGLSREEAQALAEEGKVLSGGLPVLRAGTAPRPGQTFSVRGQGKFTFVEEAGFSKKGKLRVRVEKYL